MDSPKDAFQIEAQISRAWTLPASFYTDASILAAEREKIFARTWQVVGHASQVAHPGELLAVGYGAETLPPWVRVLGTRRVSLQGLGRVGGVQGLGLVPDLDLPTLSI